MLRAFLNAIVFVWVAGCTSPRPRAAGQKGKVIAISRYIASSPSSPVSVAAISIHDVDTHAPLPPAAVLDGAVCSRPFCNASFNSRLPGAAPAKPLHIRWQAPFTPSFPPNTVLQDGDRVLGYGGAAWRLFDLNGNQVADGRTGSSGMVLDAAHGLFYFISGNGFIAARRLVDGGEEFNLNPAAPGQAWPFLARQGNRIFDLSVELPQPWRPPTAPFNAVLEYQELAPDTQINRLKIVSNLAYSATLEIGTGTVQVAMRGSDVVFAVPGRIFLSSNDLQPHTGLDADFIPRFLSIDELGRIHLIVRTGDNTALWIVTPDGQRTASIPFRPEYGEPKGPPIIGYDHRVFLLHDGVTAFDAHGELLWERSPKGTIAGGGITTDGQLIVTEGELAAYDFRGERRTLFAGISFVTPPVMSASGDIFVASSDTIYCLSAQPE